MYGDSQLTVETPSAMKHKRRRAMHLLANMRTQWHCSAHPVWLLVYNGRISRVAIHGHASTVAL